MAAKLVLLRAQLLRLVPSPCVEYGGSGGSLEKTKIILSNAKRDRKVT